MNLNYFKDESFVIKTCRAIDLDAIDVYCKVKKYEAGKKCRDILPCASTVIVVGSVVTKDMDVIKKGILADDFPCYKASREKAKEISAALRSEGYESKFLLE